MMKVFLVEDEIIMREGIRKNINWEKEGFVFAGEASDGELAYALIQKIKPDILITDIKMPFMDGLELSRLVKQELPDIKIIVLSGYDEFEYAQEGIDIGITKYLLKPVAAAKLLEEVKKVGQEIAKEREFQQTFEMVHMKNTQLAVQNFFRRLVQGKRPASELLNEGRGIGLELAAKKYNILLFQIFSGEDAQVQVYCEQQNQAVSGMEQLAGQEPEVLMIELGIEGWAFILKETGDKPLAVIQESFVKKLCRIMDKYNELEFFGGAGRPVERVSELSRCFEEASRAFAYRYLEKRNQILYSGDLIEKEEAAKDLELGALEAKKLDRKITERFLKTGLKREVGGFVDDYFQSLGTQAVQSFLFRQYMIMDIYFAAQALLEETGYGPDTLVERCGDFQKMEEVFQTAEAGKDYVKKVLETAIDLRDAVSRKKYHSLLEEARNFIEQHYDNENISLNSVAASVNMSPNHFSSIFSQEMSQTFIEYLTHVRMEKAKELLRTSSMKTAEIALAVGYKDPHYFSYLFKKTQECTPKEFRSQA